MTETTPVQSVANRSTMGRSTGLTKRGIKLRRRSRCYTPYNKTPRSRHIRGVINQQRTPPPKVNTDHFKDITNKTWRVYRVSPLFGFRYDVTHLKQYSRLLAAHILSEQKRGCAVEVEECVDRAVITSFPGLTLSPDGPEAVRIDLKKAGPKGRLRDDTGAVLTAVLCCLQPITADSKTPAGFTKLPVMLVKGPAGLSRLLVAWLQATFDCCADVLHFSPVQLSWMVAMWAGDVLERRSQPVQFQYGVPDHVAGLSRITLDLDARDCQKLWQRVHDEESSEFTEEEVTCFIKAVEQHFFYYFHIALQGMPLSRIGTGTVYAGTDGRIKIFSVGHIKQVLTHLTNLVTERTLLR